MAFEMNDLKGILLLVLFAIPSIASTNIDCSGKGFHCVSSTHFLICVDLGNGVSTTIDDVVIPCPPTTVCDKNNVFECDFPKIETTTLAPIQVIGVSKHSDTSASTSVSYIETTTTTTLPDATLRVINENFTMTTLPITREVTSEVNFKQHPRAEGEITTETGKNIQVTGSTTSAMVIANDHPSNNNIKIPSTINSNNIFTSAPEIDKIVTASITDSTLLIQTDSTTPRAYLDLISTSSQSITSTSIYSDIFNSFDTSFTNPVTTTQPYNMEQDSENGIKNERVTNKVTIANKNTFTEPSIIADLKNTTHIVNTYTQSLEKVVNNNKTHLSIPNDNNYQKNTVVWNPMTKITTKLVPETNTKYLAPDTTESTSETAKEVIGSQIITQRNFDNSSDIRSIVSAGLSFDNMLPRLSTSHENNTTTTDLYTTKQVTHIYDINENVTDKISSPKGNILGETTVIAYKISTTPVVNTDVNSSNKVDINSKINYFNQNDPINPNFADQNSTGEVATSEQLPQTNTKHFASDIVTSLLEPAIDLVDHQTTTENTFSNLELIDLIPNTSQNVSDSNSPKGSILITEEIITTEKVNTAFDQFFYKNVINIKSNLNMQNDSAYLNYTNLNSIGQITTTGQVPDINNTNKIELDIEPVKLNLVPETTTEKTLAIVELLHINSNISQNIANNSTTNDMLNNNTITPVEFITSQSTNTDGTNDKLSLYIMDEISTTEVLTTYTQRFNEDVTNINLNLNNQNDSVPQNYTELNTTKQVLDNNTNDNNLVSIPIILDMGPQTTTEQIFITSRHDLTSYDSQGVANNISSNDTTSTTYQYSPPLLIFPTSQSTNTDGTYENVTDRLSMPKPNIVIMDEISTTEVVTTYTQSFNEIINNNSNLNKQNDSIPQHYTENNSTMTIIATKQVLDNNTNSADSVFVTTVPILDMSPQTTTEKIFVTLRMDDIISYDSQSVAHNSSYNDTLNDTSSPTIQYITSKSSNTFDKNANITDKLSIPKRNIVNTDETSPIEVVTTYTQNYNKVAININSYLNNLNDSVLQNYTKINSTEEIMTTQQVRDNNTRITDSVLVRIPLEMDLQTTTEKIYFTSKLVGIIANDSQSVVNTSPSTDILQNTVDTSDHNKLVGNTDYNNTNLKDTFITPNVNILAERSMIKDEISTTEKVNMNTTRFNIDIINITTNLNIHNDLVKANNTELNSIGEGSTNEPVTKSSTNSINLVLVPDMLDLVPQTTTEKTLVTSGLVDIISNYSKSVANISPSTDILQNAAPKKLKITEYVKENATNKLPIPKENFLGERYVIGDNIFKSPMINTNNQSLQNDGINNEISIKTQNNSVNQNFVVQKSLANITKTEDAVEAYTKQAPVLNVRGSEPVIEINEVTTETTLVISEHVDFQNGAITSSSFDIFKISSLGESISRSNFTNTNTLSLKKNGIYNKTNLNSLNNQVNQTFEKQTSINEITTAQVPQTNIDYYTPTNIDSILVPVVSFQTTTAKAVVNLTTEEYNIFNTKAALTSINWSVNDSLVKGKDNITNPYEISTSTDSTTELTGYSYKMYQQPYTTSTEISNNTAGTNTTEKRATVNYSSGTGTYHKVPELTSFLPSAAENPAIKILTSQSLKNKSTVYKLEELKKEIPVTKIGASIEETANKNTILRNWTSKSDRLTNSTIDITREMISPNHSDSHGSPGKVIIKNQENGNQSKVNMQKNMDISNKTVKEPVEETIIRNNIETIVTAAPYTLDVTKNIILTNSTNSIKQIYNMPPVEIVTNTLVELEKSNLPQPPSSTQHTPELIPTTLISVNKSSISIAPVQTIQKNITKIIVSGTVPTNYEMVPSTILPLTPFAPHKSDILSDSTRILTTTPRQDIVTTPNNVISNIEGIQRINRSGQSVSKQINDFPENLRNIQYAPEQNLKETVLSLISLPSEPIKEITTENNKFPIVTEAPIRSTEFDHQIFTKEGFSNEYGKLSSGVTENVASVSGLTISSSVIREGSQKAPVTPITIPQIKTSNEDTNTDLSKKWLLHSLPDTQTIKYDKLESAQPIFPNIGGGVPTPPLQEITTEPVRTTFVHSPITLSPIIKMQKNVSAVTKDFLLDYMSTENDKNTQSISTTTETVLNSVTAPDSIVETITVNENKISGNHNIGVLTNREVTLNKTANILIVNEQLDNRTSSKTNTHISHTVSSENEDHELETVVNKYDEEKKNYPLNKFSIEEESSKSSVLKRAIDHKNKILPRELSSALQYDGKTAKTFNDDHSLVKTSPINLTETGLVTAKEITQLSDSLANTVGMSGTQAAANSENRSDIYNIGSTKTNLARSDSTLSSHNSTFNNNIERFISTNHTIMTEIQSNLNKNNKQSNKTSNELKLNGAGMHNTNHTSIKLNSANKNQITVNDFPTPFNCSNHTRGKYADKKDCRKFYICVGKLQPLIGTCPDNTVFSEINKQCTRNLSHCVRNNQFRCLYEGRFSDFFKDNIYYICVKNSLNGFVRYKLQCQNGYHLNKFLVKCEKNVDISRQSASSASENFKMNNDNSKQKSEESKKNISKINFDCEDEGKFPHETDCRKYYLCTKRKDVYRLRIKKCSSEEFYDTKKKKCIETDSTEC